MAAGMQPMGQPVIDLETAKRLRDQVQSLATMTTTLFKKHKIAVTDTPGFPVATSLREAQEMVDATAWIEKLYRKGR